MRELPTKRKPSVTIVYTGDGKGKTSAAIGLTCRSLGHGSKVVFVQFIKSWHVSEHDFFDKLALPYKDSFLFYQGGLGFYNAGSMSAQNITEDQHKKSAQQTYQKALHLVNSGEYQLVVCDEINNAVHDGLLEISDLEELINSKHKTTSLCLTGRNFPKELSKSIDILSDIRQVRHHFDDGFIANAGIDY